MFSTSKRLSSRVLALLALAFLIAVSAAHPLGAQSVTEGYGSDQALQRGMLVAVKQDDNRKVEALASTSLGRLKGVVVQASDSAVTLSSDTQKTLVATSGNYEVLVSDQNGPIKAGDYISISSLAGIGMKADDTQSVILGQATGAFRGQVDAVSSSAASKPDKRVVHFGRVPVAIAINRNPLLKVPNNSQVPAVLERISQSVANKPLSPSRMYLSAAVLLVVGLVSGVMLYSGARNSLIAIGRNPFAKKAIVRGLVQVVLLSLIIFITGIFGVYLLLKL